MLKLFKPTEANLLFDGASLALYMCGITVYIANIVKGFRTVSAQAYGTKVLSEEDSLVDKAMEGTEGQFIGREDTLRVLSASNTILALVLVGVLILQAGQWYAQRKEQEEMEEIEKRHQDKVDAKKAAATGGKEHGKKNK